MTKRELIYKEYLKNPKLSSREIGKILNLSRDCVCYHLKKLGIQRDREFLRKCNNTNRSNSIVISPIVEQIILGSILGDGTISKYIAKKHNSKLSFTHSIKQYAYLQYKKHLLEQEGIKCAIYKKAPCKEHSIKGIVVKENGSFIVQTSSYKELNRFRYMFYKDVKYINRYVYKLSPLGLAIWYMDDGYYHKGHYLCTNCFNNKDIVLLQKMLLHNFNLKTTMQKTSIGDFVLYIRAESKNTFRTLISPYVIKEMAYKLGS